MSIIEQAKAELRRINFGDDDTRVMVELIEKFLDQWDSGGAVSVALPVFVRCIAGKPLAPLTGDDDEWMSVGPDNAPMFQNMRCSTVFKDGTGRAYDIDVAGRPTIKFPYSPGRADVKMPIYEVGG